MKVRYQLVIVVAEYYFGALNFVCFAKSLFEEVIHDI